MLCSWKLIALKCHLRKTGIGSFIRLRNSWRMAKTNKWAYSIWKDKYQSGNCNIGSVKVVRRERNLPTIQHQISKLTWVTIRSSFQQRKFKEEAIFSVLGDLLTVYFWLIQRTQNSSSKQKLFFIKWRKVPGRSKRTFSRMFLFRFRTYDSKTVLTPEYRLLAESDLQEASGCRSPQASDQR